MTRSLSRWLLGVLVGVAGGALAATTPSCALSSAADGGIGGYSSETGYSTGVGTGGDASVISPDGDNPPKKLTFTEYCGLGRCVPGGDTTACLQGASSTSSGTSSASSGNGGSTGTSGAGGATSTSSGTSSGTSSTSSGPTGSGPTGSGPTGSGSTGSGGSATLGCQVSPMGDVPTSQCLVIGSGDVNAPCQSASDCGPGLGCATDGSQPLVALCRPYCCGDFEDCPTATYCAKKPMAENPSRAIPVCIGVTPCQLLTKSVCPTDKTCAIVRADGTTSCVDTGSGQFCQACPCAAGFTCSATGVCQKLCLTSSQSNDCGLGKCQGGSNNLPTGIGLCVGGDADCSHAP